MSHTRWDGSDYFEVFYGEFNKKLTEEDIGTTNLSDRISGMRSAVVSKLNEIGYLTGYDGQGGGEYAGDVSIDLKGNTLVFGIKEKNDKEMTYHDCTLYKLNYKSY